MKPILAALAIAFITSTAVTAQTAISPRPALETSIEALEASPEANLFELGMLQTLRAVERALQTRFAYNLGSDMSRMPVMRLPLPGGQNPNPLEAKPDTLSTIVATFQQDLALARKTLEDAETRGAQDFALTVTDLWFDANSNGQFETGEDVLSLLGPAVLGRRAMNDIEKSGAAEQPIKVDFDRADLAWLTAYTHMLSGLTHAYLAFDPTPVWADLAAQRAALADAPLIQNYYDQAEIEARLGEIRTAEQDLKAQMEPLQTRQSALAAQILEVRDALRTDAVKADPAKQTSLREKQSALQLESRQLRESLGPLRASQRGLRAERQALIAKSEKNFLRDANANQMRFGGTIDRIYILLTALAQEPNAEHVRTAIAHWKEMISHNRRFWIRVSEETDNANEWIPNSAQTAAFPVEITPEITKTWQDILADAGALMEGKLLIPHPLLPAGYGISLQSYAENPTPIEFVAAVQGVGFYQHAAKGPTLSALNWTRLTRLTGGNAAGFALWFN